MELSAHELPWGTVQNGFRTWPKCRRCTQLLADLGPGAVLEVERVMMPVNGKLIRVYPVEAYEFLGREGGGELGMRHTLIFKVRCHGAEQTVRLRVPHWWGSAIEIEALGELFCFGARAPGHNIVTRIK